jgi:hypothetical protein
VQLGLNLPAKRRGIQRPRLLGGSHAVLDGEETAVEIGEREEEEEDVVLYFGIIDILQV